MVISVDDSSFESKVLAAPGVVVVDFWAEWCGPCRSMSPILEDASKDLGDKVTICKMNIDENQDFPAKYMVRSIPTFIAFKDGQKIDTKIGGMTKKVFTDWLTSLTNS